MNDTDWPVDEKDLETVREAVSMFRTPAERQEGLETLERLPMTLPLLVRSGVGRKICRVFNSSRFFDIAQRTHSKWLQAADDELQKNWDQLKGLFLNKKQISDLDKAQAVFEQKQAKPSAFRLNTGNNQRLLQIAPTSSHFTQKPHSLKRAASTYQDYDYQEKDPNYTPSAVYRRYTTASEPPKKRGRPRSSVVRMNMGTRTPTVLVQDTPARRGARRGRPPNRYLL